MPREKPDPYNEAYTIIEQHAGESKQEVPFLEESELINMLELTPGQFYEKGTTFKDVLKRMSSWGWLTRVNYKGKTYYVPNKESSQE